MLALIRIQVQKVFDQWKKSTSAKKRQVIGASKGMEKI